MSGDPRVRVRVSYPRDSGPDDGSWLAEVAARHGGVLSDRLMESYPPQRDVWFERGPDADGFVADLTQTSRWHAGRRMNEPSTDGST